MTKGTLVRVGVMVGLGFLTGFLLAVTPILGGDPKTGAQLTRVIFACIWLGLLGFVIALVFGYGRLLLRRHYVMALEVRDATANALQMSPIEATWAAELEANGFHRLGETEIRPRFDKPGRFWIYVNQDATVRGSISRNWSRVSFYSTFADGASVATLSTPTRTVVVPHYLQQGANGLGAAYMLHAQTLSTYAPLHGRPVPISTMAEYIAEEHRQQQLAVPEIMAHQRWRGHLMMSVMIGILVVMLLILWPF